MTERRWQQDPRYDDVPVELADLLDIVLGDLQLPRAIDLQVGCDAGGSRLWFSEPDWPASTSVYEVPSETAATLIVDLAAWLQEQVMPETAGAWGEARPQCPGHQHPATATVIDGEAWWVCAGDDRLLARVGQWADEITDTDRN
jgi:hypothetical protein